MTFAQQMKTHFFKWRGRPVGMASRDRRCVDQPCLTAFGEVFSPSIEACPANAEVATRLCNMADLIRISKYPQFALNLALFLGHQHLHCPETPSFMKVFRA
jgi:hypothetical protein